MEPLPPDSNFLGDYIGRGPKQRESVEIVRGMVEAGNALAIMGNHEFNAIGYATLTSEGDRFLRAHSTDNLKQHGGFLEEFPFGSPEYEDIIAWFKTLPLYLELPELRAVHACYDYRQLDVIRKYLGPKFLLSDEIIALAFTKDSDLYLAIETCLKGIEIDLPAGLSYPDKDGIIRHNVRCNWWDPNLKKFREVALHSDPQIRDEWVFANPKTLKPFTSFYYSWDTARNQAGLADVRVHDLRHSFASFLVNNGRSLYEVQRFLGHTQIKTTQRYAHLDQESLLSAVNTVSVAAPNVLGEGTRPVPRMGGATSQSSDTAGEGGSSVPFDLKLRTRRALRKKPSKRREDPVERALIERAEALRKGAAPVE